MLKRRRVSAAVIVLLLFLVVISNFMSRKSAGEKKTKRHAGISVQGWSGFLINEIYRALVPVYAFADEKKLPVGMLQSLFQCVADELPIINYVNLTDEDIRTESRSTYEELIAMQIREEQERIARGAGGTWSEAGDAGGARQDVSAAWQDADGTGAARQDAEGNGGIRQDVNVSDGVWQGADGTGGAWQDTDETSEYAQGGSAQDGGVSGDGAQYYPGDVPQGDIAQTMAGSIALRSMPSFRYDWSRYTDMDDLIRGFFIVDPTTKATADRINTADLTGADMTLKGGNENPQILIYHTHSQEGYADSLPGDVSTGVVGAGEYLAQLLRSRYGLNVIHHTGQYDVEIRDQAYANAEPAIRQLLKEYPSIEVVIDLHRDEVKEGTHLAMDVDGRPTSKFMFFNGLSYSSTRGDIAYLYNPYIKDNLAFSFQAQVLANEYYPGLSRGIYLRSLRYNMHFVPKNMLIELGAQNNTREEIWNAVPIIAQILAMELTGER